MSSAPRPAQLCAALLAALAASRGRSGSRKRDQTADGIGLGMREALLNSAIHDDPEPAAFEQWLLVQAAASACPGAMQAIARAVFDEWQLAHRMDGFMVWLEHGAPSADAQAAPGRTSVDYRTVRRGDP